MIFRKNIKPEAWVLILIFSLYILLLLIKEETLRGRPGYEHLNDPLHILIEAELPVSIVDLRLRQAKEIIQELLKPVVCVFWTTPSFSQMFFNCFWTFWSLCTSDTFCWSHIRGIKSGLKIQFTAWESGRTCSLHVLIHVIRAIGH